MEADFSRCLPINTLKSGMLLWVSISASPPISGYQHQRISRQMNGSQSADELNLQELFFSVSPCSVCDDVCGQHPWLAFASGVHEQSSGAVSTSCVHGPYQGQCPLCPRAVSRPVSTSCVHGPYQGQCPQAVSTGRIKASVHKLCPRAVSRPVSTSWAVSRPVSTSCVHGPYQGQCPREQAVSTGRIKASVHGPYQGQCPREVSTSCVHGPYQGQCPRPYQGQCPREVSTSMFDPSG